MWRIQEAEWERLAKIAGEAGEIQSADSIHLKPIQGVTICITLEAAKGKKTVVGKFHRVNLFQLVLWLTTSLLDCGLSDEYFLEEALDRANDIEASSADLFWSECEDYDSEQLCLASTNWCYTTDAILQIFVL